ncbi:MAG: tyrosine-type recombinase/integrase, partial [Comamonadaceae bacterium]|nr:tyrosine-type recombinase/integrase [Comamonadaceae bacterium]
MSHEKNSRSSLKHSLFIPDPSRRRHFLHPQNLGSSTQNFEAFQTWLTFSGMRELNPASLTLACLVAFDGIASDTELQAAYAACPQASRFETAVRLDWKVGSRVEARHLSAWTTLALVRLMQWEPYDVARKQLVDALNACAFTSSFASPAETIWEHLLTTAMGWLQIHLPPVLYGHVSGAAPLSALPRSALARAQTRQAMLSEALDPAAQDTLSHPAYERAFETALLGRPASIRGGAAFIRQLLAALRPPTKGSNASKREEILRRLRSLAASLDASDEACAVLYAFALDLVEYGTKRKKNLAPTTPSDYLNALADDFHVAFDGVRLHGIDQTTYAGIFHKLVNNGATMGSARIAALKGVHQFLRAWWQVPPLPTNLLQLEVESNVRANVVWPHEKERLREWLAGGSQASRFVAQLGAALEIAGDAPLRIGELLVLRIGNVLDEGNHLVVEIARELRDGREKSREGRRRVMICDITSIAIVRTWLARRAAELATHDDYIFGEPNRPTELAHSGRMYFWLNRLLKTVSGDESISLHALRHSYASHRLATMLLQDNDDEVNPLDQLANEVGHIGGHVTAVNYCHIYEQGLRHAIDVALKRLRLDYAGTAAWTGAAPDTLRQRASRASKRGGASEDVLRSSLTNAALGVFLPPISKSIAMAMPANPLPSPQQHALTYTQVVGVLREAAAGLSTQQVALRQGVPEPQVIRIVEAVGTFAERHGRTSTSMLDAHSHGVQALRESSGRLLGMRADFGRLSQRRWRQLTDAIEKIDVLRLQRATSYWERAVDGQQLAVRPGSEWDSFIWLLADSGINRSLIAMHWSSNDQRLNEVLDTLALAQATVRYRLGTSLAQVRHTHRHGRPSIWLVISSDAALHNTNGSAHSITGLNCAFLAAWVWLHVSHP